MVWTDAHDELLCREIIGVDVFTDTKKGTTKRSAKWTMVVENLSNVETVHFKVDNRAVRDRYNLLSTNYRRKLKKEVKESGIEVEMTDIEKALEALIEKEDAAEELRQEGKLKQLTNEADRLKAGEIRKKAMESLGETKKRKTEESGVKPAKKTRSNGSETIVYLKEKHEKMLDMENKKLELQELSMEQANKRHEDLMTAMQQQQGQQMENFQVMMMQHQQHMQLQQAQQNELMLKLFGMINNK
jgi:hypothetical protein